MAELESLPADPWDGVESGHIRHRRWLSDRTVLVVVVILSLVIYAGGVVYLVLWGEW